MIPAWSSATVRAAEYPLLKAGEPLMDRAAAGLAREILRLLRRRRPRGPHVYGARIVLLVGSGNNGGDALLAGARLASRGASVTAVLTGSHAHPDGLAAAVRAGVRVFERAPLEVALECLSGADVVVDGILGTGTPTGASRLRAPQERLIQAYNERMAPRADRPLVLAVDLPSGTDPDTGAVRGAVLSADSTVALGAAKAGILAGPARRHVGELSVVPLGLELPVADVARLEEDDVRELWPRPRWEDHKYTRGVVGFLTGSDAYPGAAALGVSAAVRAGAGMVRYVGPQRPTGMVLSRCPEAVAGRPGIQDNHVHSWVCGSGIGPDDPALLQALPEILDSPVPAVLDAGALAALTPGRGLAARHVLTPHAGELERLLARWGRHPGRAAIEQEPLVHARQASELTGATVVLKGPVTIVAGGGTAYAQSEGSGWLGTAGSGDCLAGLVGMVLAAAEGRPDHSLHDDPARSAALAVWVHGRAGGAALPGASSLPDRIAEVLRRLEEGPDQTPGGPDGRIRAGGGNLNLLT